MDSTAISKTSDLLVLDLINEKNDSAIERNQIDYGLPEAFVPEDPEAELNTQVDVFAEPTSPWNNKVNIKYQRLDLQRLFGDGHIITLQEGANNADLIAAINTTFGTSLAELEFDVTPALGGAELPAEVTVKARDIGLGYTGQVKFALELGRMHLNTRLVEADLDGFGYPNANTPSLNNIVSVINASATFSPIGNSDNNIGYDTAENGELLAWIRCFETTGGWDTTNGRGVAPDENGVRLLRSTVGSHSNFGYGKVFQVSLGFHLANGDRYQTITDGYDIEVVALSKPAASQTWTTVNAFVRPNPANPAQHQLVNKDTMAVIGVFSNIGAGAATQKRFNTPSGNGLCPGLQTITTTVNGSQITRYTGNIELTLKLTRKVGRAKVVTILNKVTASI